MLIPVSEAFQPKAKNTLGNNLTVHRDVVCVCVYVRKRETERARERGREREKKRECERVVI